MKGYLYLKLRYDKIHFIPEGTSPTPDLYAVSKTSSALMEVKTINESDKELDYFDIPLKERDALRAEHAVSSKLRAKVSSAIREAEKQLLGYTAHNVNERIIYLVIRLDFQCATAATAHDLDSFLKEQSRNGIKIKHLILN